MLRRILFVVLGHAGWSCQRERERDLEGEGRK